MERSLKTLIGSCILFMMLAASVAEAGLSLGSAQVSEYARVGAGDSTAFKFLLFNAHEEDGLRIETSHEEPGGWSVSVNPSAFDLPYRQVGDSSYETGYEFLGTGSGDVKAKPIWVNVLVPADEEEGRYQVKVNVFAVGTGTVAMSQSTSYAFTLDVEAVEGPGGQAPEESGGGGGSQKPPAEVYQPVAESPGTIPTAPSEETNKLRSGVEEQINDFTGMLISDPMITPLAFIAVALVFVFLKVFKKI